MKNKKIISIIFVMLFLLLIGIMDYPFVVQILNQKKQTAVVVEYSSQAADISREQKDRYLEEARDYNYSLVSGIVTGPEIPFGDTGEEDPVYLSMLDLHEKGVMAALEIPRIDLFLPIYHGTSDKVLEEGAGHLEGSSLPIGGAATHACIAAHRGLPTKKMFTDLDQIETGDVFFIEVLGDKLAYQVYQTEVVTPEVIEPLKIRPGQDLVTLITCTPYGVNTHRIYVHGKRVPYEEAQKIERELEMGGLRDTYWWVVLSAVLLVWMFVLLYRYNR